MMDSTDRDDFAALDFSADASNREAGAQDGREFDALDFSESDDGAEDSAMDALGDYAPVAPETSTLELEALSEDVDKTDEDDVLAPFTFTVTNPPGSVSVAALIDGRIREVELTPKAMDMSEIDLAAEILVVAGLARQKGLAGQHTYLLQSEFLSDGFKGSGVDVNAVLRDFMENGVGLPTPAKAEAAQAEVFAMRYPTDRD